MARRPTREKGFAVLYELADALERLGEPARALAILVELDADAAGIVTSAPNRAARARAGRERPAVKRLLLVAFFLEIGFVLIVIPWSAFWDRNYFAVLMPSLQSLITNNFVRGAVSGLGLINVSVGLTELVVGRSGTVG